MNKTRARIACLFFRNYALNKAWGGKVCSGIRLRLGLDVDVEVFADAMVYVAIA